jgi:hypothetical protein
MKGRPLRMKGRPLRMKGRPLRREPSHPTWKACSVHRLLSRRRAAVLAGVVLLAATLTGCSGSDSGGNDAAAMVEVGDCFADGSVKPVSCTENHVAQTVYVSDSPPPNSSAALAPCREAQAKFLGQDFNTRLDVQLWVSDDKSWYRCDVVLRNSTQGRAGYQVLTESLKGALLDGVSVKLQACLAQPFDATIDQTYTPCDEPHGAQELFVAPAIGTAEEKFPGDVSRRATQACNATASAAGELVEGRGVSAYYPENSDAWSTGERSADCWVTAKRGQLPAVKDTTGLGGGDDDGHSHDHGSEAHPDDAAAPSD